ncbi:MAG: hypothetical protein KDJ99_19810, partial [Candidatus Competibacteraceae bacterium]|nr:hypothetical protein [Candidatus Competibacteraceae bacterium]
GDTVQAVSVSKLRISADHVLDALTKHCRLAGCLSRKRVCLHTCKFSLFVYSSNLTFCNNQYYIVDLKVGFLHFAIFQCE